MDTTNRRLEILKLEGLGFSQAEIAKELSQKAGCTTRTIYLDFETRGTWQPALQTTLNYDSLLQKVVNRYEQIYRQASIKLLTAQNDSIKLQAMHIMLQANAKLYETAVLPEIINRLQKLEERAKDGVFVS